MDSGDAGTVMDPCADRDEGSSAIDARAAVEVSRSYCINCPVFPLPWNAVQNEAAVIILQNMWRVARHRCKMQT